MLSLIISYLLLYKYIILFIVVLLASFAFPLPATALLMAAGALSVEGNLSIPIIIIVGFVACVLGDNLSYFFARHYGKDTLKFFGFRKTLESSKFKKLEKDFFYHSRSFIFFSRFLVTGLCAPVNLVSGFYKIPYRKYLTYEVLGEVVYVFLYAGLGYLLGTRWEYFYNIIEGSGVILVFLVLAVIIFYTRKRRKNK